MGSESSVTPRSASGALPDQARSTTLDNTSPSPIRPHESIEGNFQLDLLNPGAGDAQVAIQLRNRFGAFVREVAAVLGPGERINYPGSALALADRTNGIVIIRSDKPLLLWAWMFEQHMLRRGAASLDFPPESMSSQHIAIIPVDCGAQKHFAWVCEASEGPPPPQ